MARPTGRYVPSPGDGVEYYWSDNKRGMRPAHQPELVEKAIRTANWREDTVRTAFLCAPRTFEEAAADDLRPGLRVWFCNALSSLTREEVLRLHSSLIEGARADLADGGDFTPRAVRDRHPHIYGEAGP